MQIDPQKCAGCGKCVPYCPVGAISIPEDVAIIDLDRCIECGNCFRNSGCRTNAIYEQPLVWPRSIRKDLSNPTWRNPTTKGSGRGTAEMKSNEITGRYRKGYAGICIEMGRPDVSTSLKDVQTVLMMLKSCGVPIHVEEQNPLAFIIKNKETGELQDEVLNERVLSIIIEFYFENQYLKEIMAVIEEAAKAVDTVFSVGCVSRVLEDGTIENIEIIQKLGYYASPNCKVNLGLGRPKFVED